MEAFDLDQLMIRHMRESELSLLEWDGAFKHFRLMFESAYRGVLRGENVMWVAELPGVGIIGQVFVQMTSYRPELANGIDRAYFFSFRVKSAYRGLGIGTQMLNVMENDLRSRMFKIITLTVSKENDRARKLYERLGYRIVAHEPGFWRYQDDQGIWQTVDEPAWRMAKKIV
ncbi:MAG: GNAT family N-acetyltransferase [Anaerolineaceae bacterium]|nr:GNAT family N-acetyltransferase [Anaerolineaceae bacterium]